MQMSIELPHEGSFSKCFCLDFPNITAERDKFWTKVLEEFFHEWLSIPKHLLVLFIRPKCGHPPNSFPPRDCFNGLWTLT